MLKHLSEIWGTVVEMLSAVEHLVARVYTEAAGSKQSQGGVGANTLFSESLHLEFHSGQYHLSYDNSHMFHRMVAVENYVVLSCFWLMLLWGAYFETDSTSTSSFCSCDVMASLLVFVVITTLF